MTRRLAASLTIFALYAGQPALGVEPAALFSTSEPLVMEISADLQGFCRNPDEEDCPDLPAVVVYQDSDEREHRIETKLRLRGRWQAATADCTLPSLFLVFDPTATSGTVFEQQEVLPLTTHCRTRGTYEQYLLKEYLAHRIYNLLTVKSLGVRLAHITYHDTSGRSRSIERYGFFSEHFRSLADRFAAEVWNPTERFDHLEADPFEAATLSVFQYMIGNTDWSLIYGHNITYVRGTDWVSPVPFDLDYSGLVNSEYADPPPSLNLRSVTQRLYRGFCRPDIDWPAIFEHFTSSHADIIELVAAIPGLGRSSGRRAERYLENFFEILTMPERRESRIVSACRNP
jgi:hypothetical protein